MRDMLGKQAKILAPRDVAELLAFADCSRHPLRNRVIVLKPGTRDVRAADRGALYWCISPLYHRHAAIAPFDGTRFPNARCRRVWSDCGAGSSRRAC